MMLNQLPIIIIEIQKKQNIKAFSCNDEQSPDTELYDGFKINMTCVFAVRSRLLKNGNDS